MPAIKSFIVGLKNRIDDDSLSLVAAGVAFYIFLSLFPAMAAAISIYGLALDPQTLHTHVNALSSLMPEDAANVVSTRIRDLAENQDRSLTLGVTAGVLVSLWSANKAMKSVAQVLNIAYDTDEDRGFIKFNAVTLALTLFSSIAFIVGLLVITVVPVLVSVVLSVKSAELATAIGGWIIYACVLIGLFWIIYRFAPDMHGRSWRKLLPGAVFSTVLFILASVSFSLYVANFGKYDKQYGALGTIVVTLLWLYIGAFLFLLGAEINAQLCGSPQQPARDSERQGLL